VLLLLPAAASAAATPLPGAGALGGATALPWSARLTPGRPREKLENSDEDAEADEPEVEDDDDDDDELATDRSRSLMGIVGLGTMNHGGELAGAKNGGTGGDST